MDSTPATSLINAMSVDVEDYFQVSGFESNIDRSSWDNYPCRVEKNTDKILSLFDDASVKATFFTLGWVAERYPGLVRRIVEAGHELASHGWDHRRVTQQTPEEFREDISKTKTLLEDLTSVEVKGYRAASYSIVADSLWAHEILADCGYRYSSSIVPVNHDLYGIPDASRFPFYTAENRLLEIPVSTFSLFGKNINCGGGGWFRLFPYALNRRALKSINQKDGYPCVFYFHPWEIDPDQPKVSGAGYKSRFRHYLNLDKTYTRLKYLLDDFQWSTMESVYLNRSVDIDSSRAEL